MLHRSLALIVNTALFEERRGGGGGGADVFMHNQLHVYNHCLKRIFVLVEETNSYYWIDL